MYFISKILVLISLSTLFLFSNAVHIASKSVVAIEVIDENNTQINTATAVCINKNGYFVSSYHAVKNAITQYNTTTRAIRYEQSQLKSYPVKIINYSIDKDLVILKIDRLNTSAFKFSDDDYLTNQLNVHSIGFKENSYIKANINKGSILNPQIKMQLDNQAKVIAYAIEHNAKIDDGANGGALVNDCGDLIGINHQMQNPNRLEDNYYSISINEVKSILIDNKISYSNSDGECSNGTISDETFFGISGLILAVVIVVFLIKSPRAMKYIELISLNTQYPNILLYPNSTLKVGRKEHNDIVIDNPFVSSQHLEIRYENAKLYVKDLNSTNGTFIDSKPLAPQSFYELKYAQKLSFGNKDVVYTIKN